MSDTESIRIDLNIAHAHLETARRNDDYDSAVEVSENLARLYRLMKLTKQQERQENKMADIQPLNNLMSKEELERMLK